jgi:hypothetical protein
LAILEGKGGVKLGNSVDEWNDGDIKPLDTVEIKETGVLSGLVEVKVKECPDNEHDSGHAGVLVNHNWVMDLFYNPGHHEHYTWSHGAHKTSDYSNQVVQLREIFLVLFIGRQKHNSDEAANQTKYVQLSDLFFEEISAEQSYKEWICVNKNGWNHERKVLDSKYHGSVRYSTENCSGSDKSGLVRLNIWVHISAGALGNDIGDHAKDKSANNTEIHRFHLQVVHGIFGDRKVNNLEQ